MTSNLELQALTELIYAAHSKARILYERDPDCAAKLMELFTLISDMTNKLNKVTWTDRAGLQYALPTYFNIIDNL